MNKKNEFPTFPTGCKSLLCKYLSKEVFEELKDKMMRLRLFTLRTLEF